MNCSNTKAFSIPCGHFTKDFGSNVEGIPIVTLKLEKNSKTNTQNIEGVDGTSIRISGDQGKFLAVGGNYVATIHDPADMTPLTFVDAMGNEANEVHFTITAGTGAGVYWFRYE